MQPRFLDGIGPGPRLGDLERRKSLAAALTSKDNPWFAGAFVNRIWGELMGQSFYMPIDDLAAFVELLGHALEDRSGRKSLITFADGAPLLRGRVCAQAQVTEQRLQHDFSLNRREFNRKPLNQRSSVCKCSRGE